jgi:hypothetical protein
MTTCFIFAFYDDSFPKMKLFRLICRLQEGGYLDTHLSAHRTEMRPMPDGIARPPPRQSKAVDSFRLIESFSIPE